MALSYLLVSCLAPLLSSLFPRLISTDFYTPTVETTDMIYKGIKAPDRTSVAIFYGVPYAQPPLGNLRFRAPQPLAPSPGAEESKTLRLTQHPPSFCVQSAVYPATIGGSGSEDCLYVNIYTPTSAVAHTNEERISGPNASLPVLVYFHGGGYAYGNPVAWPFEHWVEQFPNTVVVSVYYRLNIFGFLSAPASDSERDTGMDYNVGFKDQLAALEWVNKNIEYFGGDNSKITIYGHSSGAASVQLHLVARGGRQALFQQAIAQSIYRISMKSISETQEHFNYVAHHAGCAVATAGQTKIAVECLRQKDLATLVRATEAAEAHNGTWRYTPVVDEDLFENTPGVLVNAGKFSKVPLLTGSTTDESYASTDDLAKEIRFAWPAASDADIEFVRSLYPVGDGTNGAFPNVTAAVTAAAGELLNRCAGETLSSAILEKGGTAYLYHFDQPNPTLDSPLVQHSAENWWMLRGTNILNNGTFTLTPFTTSSERRFAKELIAYWISFVHSGDPNVLRLDGSPQWQQRKRNVSIPPMAERLVLKKGEKDVKSGSFAEGESFAPEDRCRALATLANRFRF